MLTPAIQFFLMIVFLAGLFGRAQAQSQCAQIHSSLEFSNLELQQVTEVGQEFRKNMDAEVWNSLQKSAFTMIEEIRRLEKSILDYRRVTGAQDNARVLGSRRRLQQLRIQISLGQATAAINNYRALFRDVELAYWKLLRNQKIIGSLVGRGKSQTKEADLLRKENQELFNTFGAGYGEYRSVRDYLESILEKREAGATPATPEQMKTASYIYQNLGAQAVAKMFPSLNIPSERVSIEAVGEFFKKHPEALIAKLKAERKAERALAIRMAVLNYPLFNFLKAALFKLPPRFRGPLSAVLGIAYDFHVRDRYIDLIDQVVQVSDQPRFQLDLLRELNARSDAKDEMLVTFARVTNHTEIWNQVRQTALNASEESAIYKNFSERLAEAEEKAIKMGEISAYHRPTRAQNLLSVASGSSTVLIVFYWPELTQHLSTTTDFILKLFGG